MWPEPKVRVANTRCGLVIFFPLAHILFFVIPGPKIRHWHFWAGSESGTFGQGMTKNHFLTRVSNTIFYTTCGKLYLVHAFLFERGWKWTWRTECENNTFWYLCVKVILSSFRRLRPSVASHFNQEVKISFPLAYRTGFFDTTCTKLDLAHAFLFDRVQNRVLRMEC